mgnify:CR=1 FL=1
MKQAKTIMLTALAHDLEDRLADPKAEHTYLQIAHTCSEQAAQELEETVRELYPGGSRVWGSPVPQHWMPYRPWRPGSRLYQEIKGAGISVGKEIC